jgi:hypothetical protein
MRGGAIVIDLDKSDSPRRSSGLPVNFCGVVVRIRWSHLRSAKRGTKISIRRARDSTRYQDNL